MKIPDLSGSVLTIEISTMMAWLSFVMDRTLSRESVNAARWASACLRSVLKPFRQKSAFSSPDPGKWSRNGHQKSFLTFNPLFRLPTPSLKPSCNCLEMTFKASLVDKARSIRRSDAASRAQTVFVLYDPPGGLA